LTSKLNTFKNYLKYEFRSNISLFDECPYHCLAYALSDPKDAAFRLQCQHTHSKVCTACETLNNLRGQYAAAAEKISDPEMKRELHHEMETAFSYIEEYRSHILRSVNQDRYHLCKVLRYTKLRDFDEIIYIRNFMVSLLIVLCLLQMQIRHSGQAARRWMPAVHGLGHEVSTHAFSREAAGVFR
jgi:hypothetical protein